MKFPNDPQSHCGRNPAADIQRPSPQYSTWPPCMTFALDSKICTSSCGKIVSPIPSDSSPFPLLLPSVLGSTASRPRERQLQMAWEVLWLAHFGIPSEIIKEMVSFPSSSCTLPFTMSCKNWIPGTFDLFHLQIVPQYLFLHVGIIDQIARSWARPQCLELFSCNKPIFSWAPLLNT